VEGPDRVRELAGNLTSQVRNIASDDCRCGGRPVEGIGRRQGRDFGLKNTINTMVDQLRSFAAEVTRVAPEVGSRAS
jgi:hypothetical protein